MERSNVVVIGRFAPFHNGHYKLIERALELGKKVCIVFGSARSAPDIKNPWPPNVREEMLRASFTTEQNKKIHIVSVRDYKYNLSMWLTDVRNKVLTELECEDHEVQLLGYFKDDSSFYLRLFPQWKFEEFNPRIVMAATDVRSKLLSQAPDSEWDQTVPKSVATYLKAWRATNEEIFKNLCEEYTYIQKYKKDTKFVGVPYSPVFVTTDAVVVQSNHVLVIRRRFNPGKGLLALPGGFFEGW